MELHQLQYFVAVADLGSFTRGAERCLITQPSLSQQIMKLERELGQPLFERLKRTVRLTDAGRFLYPQAIAILNAVEHARQGATEPNLEPNGIVTVGAIPTVAPYLLPPVIQACLQRYPQAQVVMQEEVTVRTIENCLRGDIDIGVLALPVDEPQLHVEPLLEEELLLALPAGHSFAKRKRITMRDLDGQPFILMGDLHCLGQQVVAFCQQESCRPLLACRSAQLMTVQELVSVGHGISLLPAMACALDRNPDRIYRSLHGTKPKRTVAMIWHRQRAKRPVVQRFIELLREHAAQV